MFVVKGVASFAIVLDPPVCQEGNTLTLLRYHESVFRKSVFSIVYFERMKDN